jgi:sugar/nucleoside kinase (ribokinase family)
MNIPPTDKKILLLGPVTKDTIVRDSKTYRNIGGAVYYQSTALAHLGADITAMVTISPDDKNLLAYFYPDVRVIPVWTSHTMEFENNYPEKDNPNIRTQQAIIPNNPILPEYLREIEVASYDAFYVLPLCPHDIPLETVRYLASFQKPVFMGVQGYLRHLRNGQVCLKSWTDFASFAPYTDMLFADDQEAKCMVNRPATDLMSTTRDIVACGIREAILTSGNKGAVIANRHGEECRIPAFVPKTALYPTGLGDTYMAVYTWQRMQGYTPYEAGVWAATAASMKLEYKGAFTGSRQQIAERMQYNVAINK